tara:strand:+ start:155 stop:1375 length:1221 start_codon:yes stop_codon:yes gene_type:complete
MKPFILPLVDKFKFDNPKSYFLDYLSITFHIPKKPHLSSELPLANDIKATFYRSFPEYLAKRRLENDMYYGIHALQSSSNSRFHSITVQFSGRFWAGDVNLIWHRITNKNGFSIGREELISYATLNESKPTTNIFDDVYKVLPVFEEIEAYINHIIWNIWPDRVCTHTLSRMDIARQSKSSLNKGIRNRPHFWVKKKDNNQIIPYVHIGTNQFTAFKIGKISNSNEIDRSHPHILRVYDKNYTKDYLNQLICLNRFKTHNVIRKEWELKRRFFGLESSHKISNFWDLMTCVNNEPQLLHLIKTMRLSKDCILYNDSQIYFALHDKESRKALKKAHKLPLYKLNKLYKKVIPKSPDLIFDTNKVQNSDIQEPYVWNAFKHIRGTLFSKKVQLTGLEKNELIKILKQK